MIANRPYRSRLTVQEAKEELIRFSGTQFDPQVVDAFIKVLERDGNLPNQLSPFALPQQE